MIFWRILLILLILLVLFLLFVLVITYPVIETLH